MTTKHTTGPWHVGMKPGPMIYGSNGEQIADMRRPAMVDDDEHKENARLIAAAPDLLAAAEAVLRVAESPRPKSQATGCIAFHETRAAVDLCRAAIAKAKGESC